MGYTSLDKFVKRKNGNGETPSAGNNANQADPNPQSANKRLTGDEIISMPGIPNGNQSAQKRQPHAKPQTRRLNNPPPQQDKLKAPPPAPIAAKVSPKAQAFQEKPAPKKVFGQAAKANVPAVSTPQKRIDPEMEGFLKGNAGYVSLSGNNKGGLYGGSYGTSRPVRITPILPEGWYIDAICIALTIGALAGIILKWDVVQSAILSILFDATDIVMLVLTLGGIFVIGYWLFFRNRRRR